MNNVDVRLQSPENDLADFSDQLGQAWAVGAGESLGQYVVWADEAGIFGFFETGTCPSSDELRNATPLSDAGFDALLCVLLCLKLILPGANGRLTLSTLAREYLLRSSPYYIGPGLGFRNVKPIPPVFLREQLVPPWDSNFDESRARSRLLVQHSRNFAPSVVAARSGSFRGVRHLIDIGGGSGVFAIPLALDDPDIRITLVDLPVCLAGIRDLLGRYDLSERVTLVGMDIFAGRWDLPECDGVLFGNLFHAFNDAKCDELSRRAFDLLAPEGRLWLHEVLFEKCRDAPMIAALWNANMQTVGGRQRTATEFFQMLERAGFSGCSVLPTAGHFSLVACRKPEVDS